MVASETYLLVENSIATLFFVAFILIFLASIFFIIIVTHLKQWDRYYPPVDKWLRSRAKAKQEQVRKEKKHQAWLRKRGKE